jgi:hypothetical protein
MRIGLGHPARGARRRLVRLRVIVTTGTDRRAGDLGANRRSVGIAAGPGRCRFGTLISGFRPGAAVTVVAGYRRDLGRILAALVGIVVLIVDVVLVAVPRLLEQCAAAPGGALNGGGNEDREEQPEHERGGEDPRTGGTDRRSDPYGCRCPQRQIGVRRYFALKVRERGGEFALSGVHH